MQTIFTVGHSTHTLEAFAALLQRHGIVLLADVRIIPRSRRHPQFNAEALAAELPRAGVEYRHIKALGGRRTPRADSPNRGWDNAAFRGYADYALTPSFAGALAELSAAAHETPAAIMCAEGLWWQCHRRLIADRLLVAGWTVRHIKPDGGLDDHVLPPFAAPQRDGTVRYPPPATLFE